MGAKNATHTEMGDYLCSSIVHYTKHVFWEVPYHMVRRTITLEPPIFIEHASNLTEMKSYWTEDPWYVTECSEEAAIVKRRIEQLTAEFGPAPPGLARSCNPECRPFYSAVVARKPPYVNISD